ncbi:hypothetical protein H4R34_000420 [Dimargaris verticillata]|uniref:G protein-coupled receptor n=1 Tax=Dimargaris verticillata TaxID=2761393 RepID=A0A9W8B854_9FUNG|nr:hypothetical protein H4R34_000420 [Dimargaris verticillata]
MALVDFFISLYVLDALSILCSFACIAIVLWVWYKQPSSKESPSFNLTLWIGIADLPLRVCDILSNPMTFMGNYPSSPHFGKFIMWLNYFSSFWFIYLNCMITLDLQLVFFHRLPRQARIRRWYPLLGTGIAFFMAFWYLVLPTIVITPDGFFNIEDPTGLANRFSTIWTNICFHVGIIYAIIVVVAVCFKVFRSQAHLRRFDQGEHAKAMSKALIRNTRLIIAYPIVLFIVYVPYVLNSWFSSFLTGPFPYYWNLAYTVVYNAQGIFSFIILLFHPVMLSTYRQNNFGFSSLWSRVSRRLGTSPGTYQSSMGTGATSGPTMGSYGHSGASGSHGTNHLHASSPYIKTMDMGPGVTGYFDNTLEAGESHTMTMPRLKGLEGMEPIEADAVRMEKDETLAFLDDPTCL